MVDQHGMGLHLHLISRGQAKSLGIEYYFTGKPCGQGGIWHRRTSNYSCRCELCVDIEQRYRKKNHESRAKYDRERYENNREAALEYQRIYREKNRKYILERDRRYREEHCDLITKKSRKYQKENRELLAKNRRKYYEKNRQVLAERQRRYCEQNREAVAERKRRYARDNPHMIAIYASRRRAAKANRTLMGECELTQLVEREAYSLARERLAQTGVEWHVDHMLPMNGETVSGLHHWSNLQVIPASLNLSKYNRMIYTEPFEWVKDA